METLKATPTSALQPCAVCLHSQGCQGQAQQRPQEHAQDRGHRHAPRHCCQWGNAAAAAGTCRDGEGQREAGIRTAAGAGGSGHGQSHLGKHPRAGSCYLQCWWPRSCPRCPRHRRCGRPPRGRRTAGARAPRGSARARGPPPGIAPSPARRGPSPVRGRPPASPRCHSPAGGTQRQLWRGWCRWRTRGPTSPRAAPPGARCSCCCPPPDAAALQQQGTGGRGTIGTGGAARTPRAAGPAPHPAQGSQCSPT